MAAVAPMDLVMRNDTGPIPLRCTICPKKPNFSDLSHLLTHISSKSHLAHRFKAELKARDDRVALEEVRQYDSWCERYGINALLAERMAAKERKKTGRRARPSNRVQSNTTDAAALQHELIKQDPDNYHESLQVAAHWPMVSGHYHHGQHDPFDISSYPTPSLKRSRSDRSNPTTPENETRKYRRWPSETETTDSFPVSEIPSESTEFDDENDTSKLKGVRFPGMGLFDSADETQKRMRNQRKDESVLKHMEETSSGIVPNEFVWTEDGEFQRVRDIYASPSIEGSPGRLHDGCDTQKRKRGRRSTTAGAAKSARTRTSTRPTRQTTSKSKGTRQGDDDDLIHGSVDGYDIFRDPPKPSPVRSNNPHLEHGYELRRRPVLQSTNKNNSMAPGSQKPAKPVSYIPTREAAATAFTTQPPVSSGAYFHHPHTLGPGSFNPLSMQARGGYYNPYGYTNFGHETKPPPASFQAINAMNLGNMPFSGFGGHFPSDAAHEAVDHDFDL